LADTVLVSLNGPAATLLRVNSKACFPGVQQIHAPTAEVSI
jgi:hypothetical protein